MKKYILEAKAEEEVKLHIFVQDPEANYYTGGAEIPERVLQVHVEQKDHLE
ncbi:hypothetical protein [Terracidiphilus sp.]|jgi:hypothetical protein|uniref:hypothetical protein n=1 Tax=Terracidiphilus sp. TaxID=1964191 RepID=UPI003C26BD88